MVSWTSPRQFARALDIVCNVEGVRSVQNNLILKLAGGRSPSESSQTGVIEHERQKSIRSLDDWRRRCAAQARHFAIDGSHEEWHLRHRERVHTRGGGAAQRRG